jgi:hypothetical protein
VSPYVVEVLVAAGSTLAVYIGRNLIMMGVRSIAKLLLIIYQRVRRRWKLSWQVVLPAIAAYELLMGRALVTITSIIGRENIARRAMIIFTNHAHAIGMIPGIMKSANRVDAIFKSQNLITDNFLIRLSDKDRVVIACAMMGKWVEQDFVLFALPAKSIRGIAVALGLGVAESINSKAWDEFCRLAGWDEVFDRLRGTDELIEIQSETLVQALNTVEHPTTVYKKYQTDAAQVAIWCVFRSVKDVLDAVLPDKSLLPEV